MKCKNKLVLQAQESVLFATLLLRTACFVNVAIIRTGFVIPTCYGWKLGWESLATAKTGNSTVRVRKWLPNIKYVVGSLSNSLFFNCQCCFNC